MNYLDPPVPIEKIMSENKIRSKIKVKEYNDWETSDEEQAKLGGKIEVDYPKVDADTVEDKLLNLQRALEHLRKARLLKNGLKTQLDRIEQFHAGETEQAFRAWKTGFVEDPDNLTMNIKEALQNWMIGFVNENARREQLNYMQRHLVKPFEVTPTKFLQRIRIMTALLDFLPTTEGRTRNINKDELKYIYVYAMPNVFLNKAYEVNFNLHAEALTDINSYFESLDKASKKRKAMEDAKREKNKSEDKSFRKRAKNGTTRGDDKNRGCSLCLEEGRYRQVKTHSLADCRYKAKKAESNAIRQDESDEEFHHSKVSNNMKNVPLQYAVVLK